MQGKIGVSFSFLLEQFNEHWIIHRHIINIFWIDWRYIMFDAIQIII
jgi:hypothetical protein